MAKSLVSCFFLTHGVQLKLFTKLIFLIVISSAFILSQIFPSFDQSAESSSSIVSQSTDNLVC